MGGERGGDGGKDVRGGGECGHLEKGEEGGGSDVLISLQETYP